MKSTKDKNQVKIERLYKLEKIFNDSKFIRLLKIKKIIMN